LNDPLRISSLISASPTDPDAPRTTAACVLDMKCLSSICHHERYSSIRPCRSIATSAQALWTPLVIGWPLSRDDAELKVRARHGRERRGAGLCVGQRPRRVSIEVVKGAQIREHCVQAAVDGICRQVP
jgi:hypothetical protein